MEIVEGTIGQVGRVDWGAKKAPRGGAISVIEVGHRHLKRVVLADPLSRVLESGKFARVLIWRGLTQGLVTHPVVAAVEVDGKIYKSGQVLTMAAIRVLVWMILVLAIGSVAPALGVFTAACIIGFYTKHYLDYLRF